MTAFLFVLVAGSVFLAASPASNSPSTLGAAATVRAEATGAAMEALESGGNAMDAAVAAALTLGVVDGYNSGIGGGCFILGRLKNGLVFGIDGRETAPALATRDLFVRDGRAQPELSQTGALAVAVPGALAAYELLARTHGRFPLARPLRRAAEIAEKGFVVDRDYADRLQSATDGLGQFEGSRAIFLDSDGRPLPAGAVLRQSDLAATYRAIARSGVEWFYQGPFAQRVGEWMAENGGVLRASDFADYRARWRSPVTTTYRGFVIHGFPPPSSGGVHVAQILNILENFDLRGEAPRSADLVHLAAEAMKRAFADRAHWLGDPEFADVPPELVTKPYAARLARQIRSDQAGEVREHGKPLPRTESEHTTHFTVADAEGNWVACTATINTTFGSKIVVPNTGVVLNNEMDDFSAQPGAPNFFGLIGSEANSIAPGKRPLSSMSPTIVVKDGEPVFSIGAKGGPTIINQVVLGLIDRIDFDLSLEQSLALPRIHHQWRPDVLQVERGLEPAVVAELERRGHTVELREGIGAAQAIGANRGALRAVHDPRVTGAAASR